MGEHDEQLPLLHIDEETENKGHFHNNSVKEELWLLVKIAIPVIITNLSAYLLLTESIILTGQLTKFELDATALANSVITVAGVAIGTGLCTACDTFFSQMYGSRHRRSIGIVLQKSIMIITLFPIVLIAFHINAEPIFILMKQDVKVSLMAAKYMSYFSPGLLFAFNFLILTRYMQNLNRVLPPMFIGIAVNIFNITSQYLCIYTFGFGFLASPICLAISFFLFWILNLLYIFISGHYKDSWDGWSKEAFLEWGFFLKLAIPGAAMVVMENFCFEIGTILSGVMSPVQLAAQSVIFQLETITFMISFGVGVAVNIRVGHALGSAEPKAALKSYRCGMFIMFISFCITTTIELGLMKELPKLFTNDKEAQEVATGLIPLIVGVQFFDAIGTVTMGALRGCGRQKICVLIIFVSYYVLGQPIGISLGFLADWKTKGLWTGLLISLAICVPVAFIYTNFIQDWKKQAESCRQRVVMAASAREEDANEKRKFGTVITTDDGEYFEARGKSAGSHKRSLSHSFTAFKGSIRVKMVEVPNRQYRSYITRRILTLVGALIILFGGILVHFFLPRSLYLNTTSLD